jgi:electron transfer flavoprotein alpha subunit
MTDAIWVIGEIGEGNRPRPINDELATLGRNLGAASGRDVVGVVGIGAQCIASQLAKFLPRVVIVRPGSTAGQAVSPAAIAVQLAALVKVERPSYLMLPATPEGRDVAGGLSALLDWPVLVNATRVEWQADGPVVEMSALGGRVLTKSAFAVAFGIITVRPGAIEPAAAESTGTIEVANVVAPVRVPQIDLVERSDEGTTSTEDLDTARVVVTGGRGVGGADGFLLVRQLADELGGAVGATRPPVDENWIAFSHQIGQTGRTVRPKLFIGLGVAGDIQHRVGMQSSEAIVAVNKDPGAPIAGFADLFVQGDLFEIVPELIGQLKAHRSGAE